MLEEILNHLYPIEELRVPSLFSCLRYKGSDKPVKEIAEVTGLTLSNVKVKLHRGRNTLRQMITKKFKHNINDLL